MLLKLRWQRTWYLEMHQVQFPCTLMTTASEKRHKAKSLSYNGLYLIFLHQTHLCFRNIWNTTEVMFSYFVMLLHLFEVWKRGSQFTLIVNRKPQKFGLENQRKLLKVWMTRVSKLWQGVTLCNVYVISVLIHHVFLLQVSRRSLHRQAVVLHLYRLLVLDGITITLEERTRAELLSNEAQVAHTQAFIIQVKLKIWVLNSEQYTNHMYLWVCMCVGF